MTQPDSQQIELDQLQEVNRRPWFGRILGYASLSGPGWIQGALTLGASTATSSFYLGWKFGYDMLWVNALGMLMGVIMFAAIARPALTRPESVYSAMARYLHPGMAMAWAVAAAVTSSFWAMNQYSVATACLADLAEVGGWISGDESLLATKWILALIILGISIPLTWTYGRQARRGVRLYEWVLKGVVGLMVICLLVVAARTGIRWGDVLAGFIPNGLPEEANDRTMVLGALGCAVGINMTFLFPLTLRARGWRREHLGLARFDLFAGMLIPFALVTSLVVVTTANVLHGSARRPDDPATVAQVMTPLFEGTWLPGETGRILFDLGVAAMPLSTITILMLIAGLALCEVFGKPHSGTIFRIGTLLPSIGVLGAAYKAPFWLGPLISSFALIFLPIAYIGFLLLCNNRSYLGEDFVGGKKRIVWNVAMGMVVVIAVVGALVKVKDSLGSLF